MEQELPYITSELPGIGGKLRGKSEHFVVEEIPLYEPSGEGTHLYVNITKKDLTTKEVQKMMADLLGLQENDVGFAGLKDKHAIATQTFSISLEKLDADGVNDKLKGLPIKINWTKLHNNKLKIGHLLGNKFTILISGTDKIDEAKDIVNALKKGGVPNYFGEQRFGIEGNNVEKAKAIISGEMKVKDKWLKRFLLSSYQSYLCNLYLAKRINEGLFDKLLLGDIAKKYETGGLFDVEDLEAEQKRYENGEISFTAPIYGKKMREASSDAKELEDSIIEGLDVTKLGIGNRRLGKLKLDDVKVEKTEDGLHLEFLLPKGAFATVVLRELMKSNDFR